jgi:hypothetical protein
MHGGAFMLNGFLNLPGNIEPAGPALDLIAETLGAVRQPVHG